MEQNKKLSLAGMIIKSEADNAVLNLTGKIAGTDANWAVKVEETTETVTCEMSISFDMAFPVPPTK